MRYLTQTLKTKTGCSGWRITHAVRQAYGACVGWLKQHPEDQPALSAYLDMTPRDRTPEWYVGALRGWIAERQQAQWLNAPVSDLAKSIAGKMSAVT